MESRIFGGKPVDTNRHKYLVKLSVHNKETSGVSCSGSIISSRWIITAAHCIFPNKPIKTDITHFRDGNRQVIVEIEKYFKHPDYNNTRNYVLTNDESKNDVALLKTKKGIVFDDYVKPIKLIDRTPEDNSLATIIGYGMSETIDFKPREAKVRLYRCGDKKNVLCSKSPIRPGQGDSGGPVVVSGRLAGITASGCDHCESAYVNVVEHLKWIRTTITNG
ncbi:unnamed protein product [Chilo suppressalis]|uniref:Peptidase S1 domain-containing protein n=1 Tax=Chilo suppressalis TaxID=168631 RepID=A0ABN8B3I2_CHISP|nr:unnamed protein product [Chilo suppressalis]